MILLDEARMVIEIGNRVLEKVYKEAYGLNKEDVREHLNEIQNQIEAERLYG